ncbi:leucine-rich repeat domain-containing protein [Chitinophaga sp. S165]|uniref:leucine-rich repeat domain-containing protein n=1 Tax=Chitinophaga sp. S165 TaxID=2135462 RepID=UPI000D986B02|nr:leucine-rich repeat domain-containing protein [Chitinophaga sp. S165]PWV46503.1 Leucine-rich repeat (LRR) protein [Chitinophaga sp. S165]
MPLILSAEEAENRFQISKYDPVGLIDNEMILLFEGDTDIPGHFDHDYVTRVLQEAGGPSEMGELLVVVNGNLNVDGDIVFSEYRPALLVLGDVTCHVLQSADECMLITGNATIKYAFYGYYNDGTITIEGITKVPYVLNSDHHSQINPVGAVLINKHSDYDDFFEYDFTAQDLPEVLVPEILGKGGRLEAWDFIDMLKAGKSPFKPGAKTPRQVFDERLEQLTTEDPLSVTEVDLSEQKFKAFPQSLTALQNLRKLTLSKNKLKTIPDDIGKLEHLEELYLYDCALVNISAAIGDLKNLRVLDISLNRELTVLPDTIGQLGKLQRLKIDYINMNFSPAFEHLSDLEEIGMYSCYPDAQEPTVFPEALTKLKKLRKLDLRKNMFQALPEALVQLPLLEEIRWTDSATASPLPDFSLCRSLKTLVISRCFSQWKNIVFNIHSLEHLQIDRNKEEKEYFDEDTLAIWKEMAAEEPEKFGHLADVIKNKQLEPDGRYSVLTRRGITLQDLEGLKKLPNLRYLDLSFNGLTTLPDSVYTLSKLEHLNLEYNKLSDEEKGKVAKVFNQAKLIF